MTSKNSLYILLFSSDMAMRDCRRRKGTEESQVARVALIDLKRSKGAGDDVVAMAIVYMNRLVIPLCRLQIMIISQLRFLKFNGLLPLAKLRTKDCSLYEPHMMK